MLENVVKRSEFVYTREQRYTKVIYYYYYVFIRGGRASCLNACFDATLLSQSYNNRLFMERLLVRARSAYRNSLVSTQTLRRALTASVDRCALIKERHFTGVTNSGRVHHLLL